jgi:hypothetical protein
MLPLQAARQGGIGEPAEKEAAPVMPIPVGVGAVIAASSVRLPGTVVPVRLPLAALFSRGLGGPPIPGSVSFTSR